VRAVMCEHTPARDDKRRRFGGKSGERPRGFGREAVVVDVATSYRSEAFGRCHITPHVARIL
jgi:hypothetical protein